MKSIIAIIILMFPALAAAAKSPTKNNPEALDSIADYYFNYIDYTFYPYFDEYIEMTVETQQLPFMDEIAGYIHHTIEKYPTSIFTKEQMLQGVYTLNIFNYKLLSLGSNYKFAKEIKADGSYIFSVWFDPFKFFLDSILFDYKGLRFGTGSFLLPFFEDIKNISIVCREWNSNEDGWCSWMFEIYCGKIVSAYYTNWEYFLPDGSLSSISYDLINHKEVSEYDVVAIAYPQTPRVWNFKPAHVIKVY